jgi:hypothetical protein
MPAARLQGWLSMTDSASRNDKTKIALIPVLGLVLFYVLMGGEDSSGSLPIQLVRRPVVNSEHTGRNADRPQSGYNVSWPGRSLHAIVEHNPFELTDPRAILDADFERYGVTEWLRMAVVAATVFFENDVDAQGETERATAGSGNSAAQHATVDLVVVAAADARRARIEVLQQRILALQNTPITMIMTSVRGKSALFGDRNITEGELMEDGIRVVSISRNGITFEIVDDTNSH